jgi:hypothetical protein
MGIEPTSEAWEASILPLYDARLCSDCIVASQDCNYCFLARLVDPIVPGVRPLVWQRFWQATLSPPTAEGAVELHNG